MHRKFRASCHSVILWAGAISIISLLANSPRCWASDQFLSLQEIAASNPPSHSVDKTTSKTDMQQQFQQLENKITQLQTSYNQRLQQMQQTIDLLKAQISKNQTIPTTQAVTQKTPAASQEDIGTHLIFGSEAKPQTSSKTTATQATSQNGDIGDQLIFGNGQSPQTGPETPVQPSSSYSINSGAGSLLGGGVGYNGSRGQSFNPDISVTGDFIGHYGSRSSLPSHNRIDLRESEIGLQAAVDPYARATFIFSKPSDGNLDVEEGYATLDTLPWGLQVKVGKMRSPFGKVNVLHTHDLPQTDEPDVISNFFGSDGLIETGVSVSKILPTPWYSSLDVQMANGDNNIFFGHGRLTKPLVVSHLKNFFDINDNNSLELGLSTAVGARTLDSGARDSKVAGIDFTYHWLQPNLFHTLVWQTELLGATQGQPYTGKNTLFGGYSFVEYKLATRWFAGVRLDYSQVPLLANANEWSIAPYIDFWESEFGRFRLEYKHTFGHNYQSSDQAWLQYSVILGLHPPHTF